ncbi:unnamed protein product [Leptidea sinapis]|uniref:Choline transporter-like protein n=1 Tax=Leptidea sinapis TaxID=189913 RepID=A0A5E4Q5L1_9NEOP|nr:unnamed protein product [Leptidea sinapis]
MIAALIKYVVDVSHLPGVGKRVHPWLSADDYRGSCQNAHSSPVLYSIGKLLKYHLGSVAKGSFLITLLSARAEKGSDCAKCGLKCGICCFYCLEKFIRYLNHNAYTIITIERL